MGDPHCVGLGNISPPASLTCFICNQSKLWFPTMIPAALSEACQTGMQTSSSPLESGRARHGFRDKGMRGYMASAGRCLPTLALGTWPPCCEEAQTTQGGLGHSQAFPPTAPAEGSACSPDPDVSHRQTAQQAFQSLPLSAVGPSLPDSRRHEYSKCHRFKPLSFGMVC